MLHANNKTQNTGGQDGPKLLDKIAIKSHGKDTFHTIQYTAPKSRLLEKL